MDKRLRVLMVLAATQGSDQAAIWARSQVDSFKGVGMEIATFVFKNRRSLKGLLLGGRALRRHVRSLAPDLVHVHYGAAQAFIAILCSPKPVVISFCGSDLFGNYNINGRKTWSGRLSVLLSQLAAVGARRCIAKTEQLKRALWLPSCQAKCEVIPNGVDLNQFRSTSRFEARAAIGWSHDDPVILFSYQQETWVKDPYLAYAAYEEAKKIVPLLRMHVLENEPHEMMPFFYNAADVLLITSRHEGSNNTVKEAMACGLPIVATACGDITERLRGVTWSYVLPRDRKQLGMRLADVVSARERSNGRQHILDLAINRIASNVIECYVKALCI